MDGPLKEYVRTRSARAFSATVHAYQEHILNAAFHVVKDVNAAEDVTQTVLLKLLRSPPRLRSIHHERAYLVRCALRAAQDWQRAEARRRRRERSAARDERITAVASENAQVERLRAAIATLPGELRTAVYLHYFHGFRVDEIAEALHCHRNTASRRLERARASLRQLLGASATAALLSPLSVYRARFELAVSPRLKDRLADLIAQAADGASVAASVATSSAASAKWLYGAVGTLVLTSSLIALWPREDPTTVSLPSSEATPLRSNPESDVILAAATVEPEPSIERSLALPALRGRVVESEGEKPVAECRVRIRSGPYPSADPLTMPPIKTFETEIVTDAEGRFALESLPLGVEGHRQFDLVVENEGWSRANATVLLHANDVGEATLRVSRGLTVFGTARRADGQAVTQGEVFLTAAQPRLEYRIERARATIASDGTFRFRGAFVPGVYVLEAISPGLRTEQVAPIELSASELEHEAEIVFSPGRKLFGTVRHVSGMPAAGVTVTANPNPLPDEPMGRIPAWPRVPAESDTTDSDGQFEIDGLWPGNYVVYVDECDAGGLKRYVRARIDRVSPLLEQSIDIVLQRRMRIEGIATRQGRPVVNSVLHFRAYNNDTLTSSESKSARITTDEMGAYRVDLPEGLWKCVWRTASGSTSGWQDVDLVSPSESTKRLDISLDAGLRLEILVLDPQGQPAPASDVRVRSNGQWDWALKGVTDSSGRFTFEGLDSDIHSDSWFAIEVKGDGFEGRASWAGTAPPDAELVVETKRVKSTEANGRTETISSTDAISSPPSLIVKGIVYGQDGTVAPRTEIRGPQRSATYSGADGRYELRVPLNRLESSSMEIHARNPAVGFVHQEILIPRDEPLELSLDLRLESGIRYHGRVIDEAGAPVMFASIAALPASIPIGDDGSNSPAEPWERPFLPLLTGPQSIHPQRLLSQAPDSVQGRADALGRYTLTVPRDEPVRLIAWVRGHGQCLGPVFTLDPTTSDVEADLVLEEGFSVVGRLILANGQPAANVALWNNGTPFVTDGEGRFFYSGFERGEEWTVGLDDLPGSPRVGITFVAGEAERTIRAPAEAVIRGRVLLPDGSPAPVFHVEFEYGVEPTTRPDGVSISDSGSNFSPRLLPGGRFQMAGLAPGRRRFAVRAPGAAPAAFSDVTVAEGEIKDLEIPLVEGGEIHCRFAGEPPFLSPHVRAVAMPTTWNEGSSESFASVAEVSSDGTVVVRNVTPGIVNLSLGNYRGKSVKVKDVRVENGAVTEVTVNPEE